VTKLVPKQACFDNQRKSSTARAIFKRKQAVVYETDKVWTHLSPGIFS
jgi:hypothetical protein